MPPSGQDGHRRTESEAGTDQGGHRQGHAGSPSRPWRSPPRRIGSRNGPGRRPTDRAGSRRAAGGGDGSVPVAGTSQGGDRAPETELGRGGGGVRPPVEGSPNSAAAADQVPTVDFFRTKATAGAGAFDPRRYAGRQGMGRRGALRRPRALPRYAGLFERTLHSVSSWRTNNPIEPATRNGPSTSRLYLLASTPAALGRAAEPRYAADT